MAKSLAAVFVLGAVSASFGYSGYWRHLGVGGGSSHESARGRSSAAVHPDRVVALGRLEPHGGLIAVSAPPGARLERLEVREGQAVRRGQTIAVLEGRDELAAEKTRLEAQIVEAKRRLETERQYEEVLQSEAALERRQVEEVEPREIEAQQAKIDLLRESLSQSQRELERIENLTKTVALSTQEVERAQFAVRRDRQEIHAAELVLEKLRKAHEISKARLGVQGRKLAVGTARAEQAIPLDSLRAGLKVVEAKLSQLEIKAPIDGRVLKVATRPGETTGARPIVQLGDVDAMEAVAEVYETDRKRVREGQRVEVRSQALPDDHPVLHGVVERIGWSVAKNDVLGLDPAADAYARVVEVRVRLDAEDASAVRHLTNLQVDVTIEAPDTGPPVVQSGQGARLRR